MGNTLFILDYRAGSHLLLKLLLGRPAIEINGNGKYQVESEIYAPGRMLASKPHDFPMEICFSDVTGILGLQAGVHRYTYMGDWWGQVNSSKDVPDPYDGECPTRWDHRSIDLIGHWNVVRLVRDPRGHIESLRRTPGESNNPHQVRDPFDYFLKQCKAARNRLRVAIDCRDRCKNYRIFKSEDLVSDPMGAIREMDAFADLHLDFDELSIVVAKERGSRAADLHSTFKNSNGYNVRHASWTDEEVAAAERIFGLELRDLDYERSI
jgi:hypothetical protein